MINSVGVVVFVRVVRASSIALIRVRVIGHSALGLDRVRDKRQKPTSIEIRQITVATPHMQQDRISCSGAHIAHSALIRRINVNKMDQFHAIFEYLPAHRIAVCKHHQQGIVQSQLEGHLNKQHQELVWRTRQKIVQAAQEETSLQQWAVTQDEVVYPSPDAAPLPHLPVYIDG